jgi:hypothetical protein
MRRMLLAWALLLAGVFCLLQQPAPKAYWQSRAQQASAAACTAPSLDVNVNASVFGDWSSGSTFNLSPLSSTGSNVVVVVFVEINGLAGTDTLTVTDSAMLLSYGTSSFTGSTWTGTNRFATPGFFSEFVSKSSTSALLAGDTLTVTTSSAAVSFGTAQAFVVDGVNLSSLFDQTNGSMPNGSATSSNATVSTINNCTMIINGLAETGTATPTAPWTQILQRNFLFTQYARFTSPQSSFTIPQFGGSSSRAIGDALTSP